jgi:large subunit ribosomal protein L6
MGFSTQLEIIGVGYKAEVKTTNEGSLLLLKLGFSHPISLKVPVGIDVSVVKTSKNSLLVFSGINNELINSFASKVRDYRCPEPYKGKGLSYLGEQVRRKEGKKK